MKFYSFALNFHPITLLLKFGLNVEKMCASYENEFPSFSSSKVIAWKDTQTDTQTDSTEIITCQHTHMV